MNFIENKNEISIYLHSNWGISFFFDHYFQNWHRIDPNGNPALYPINILLRYWSCGHVVRSHDPSSQSQLTGTGNEITQMEPQFKMEPGDKVVNVDVSKWVFYLFEKFEIAVSAILQGGLKMCLCVSLFNLLSQSCWQFSRLFIVCCAKNDFLIILIASLCWSCY